VTALALALDAAVCAAVVWLGAQAVLAPRAGTAAAAFIALGVVMALAWARLNAPDVALAEAALGAGLTGALLLRHLALTGEGADDGDPR
jgi:uncharacterized MnhB-related membrane protein